MPLPTRAQQLGLLILLGFVDRLHHLQERSVCARRFSPSWDLRRRERARSASSWRCAAAAKSSAAIRRPCTAASISAPTRCRSPSGAAFPIICIDVVEPTDEYTAARYVQRRGRCDRADLRARAVAHHRRRHGSVLPRARAGTLSRTRCGRADARTSRRHRATPGRRVSPPHAEACRCGVRRADSGARSEAHDSRSRSLLPDGNAADRSFRGDRVAACGLSDARVRAVTADGADRRARREARRRAVRTGTARRDPRSARARHPGNGASVRRTRVPAGARAPARREERGRDARADHAREPSLRAPAVDLVPQRA